MNYNFIGVNKSDLAIPWIFDGLFMAEYDEQEGQLRVGLTVNIPIIDWVKTGQK